MNQTTFHLSIAELIVHRGSVFSVWSEYWESSHPEDAYEDARFAFSESVAREEFLMLKSKLGTYPNQFRESLALFRISIDPKLVLALSDDDGQIDGRYLHPVVAFRRTSAFSKLVRSELIETAGGALGVLWSQLKADLPRQPSMDESTAELESKAAPLPAESLEVLLDQLEESVLAMPKCAGTLPGGTIDPSIDRINQLRASIMAVLGNHPPRFAREVLDRCASLADVSYHIEYYYPPAALVGGDEVEISFEPVRSKARSLRELPFTPPPSTGDEALEIAVIIQAWAEWHDLPLQGQAVSAERLVLLVLNGEKISGEMSIVGQIAILTVRHSPPSYAIETADGGRILDESWADASSLPSVLDHALRMLRQRVKTPMPQWAVAFASPPPTRALAGKEAEGIKKGKS